MRVVDRALAGGMSRPIEGHCRERMRERVQEAGGAAHVRLAGGAAAWPIPPAMGEGPLLRAARVRGSARPPGARGHSASRSPGVLAALVSRLHTDPPPALFCAHD